MLEIVIDYRLPVQSVPGRGVFPGVFYYEECLLSRSELTALA